MLIGRDRELAELDDALSQVREGTRVAVELVGEPGIGKSRLLAEVRGRAEGRGFLVLEGRAAEFEYDIPFSVIVDALNDRAGTLSASVARDLEPDTLQELGSILPSLAAYAPEHEPRRQESQRYRVHYAVRALLERLASERPVLLSLDDIHWADAASLEVIAHLVRRFRGPLLAMFAYRPGRVRLVPTIESDVRLGSARRIDLAPLTETEAAALLDPTLDPAARDALYRASGGNPFYLGELARSAGEPVGPGPAPGGDDWTVPSTVLAVIEEELGRLTPDRRRILEAAAVAGESFEPRLVSAIAEMEEASVLAAFDALEEQTLIRPASGPRTFRFRHPIMRRAAYDAAPGGWRSAAHARAAAALAEVHASVAEQAHHVALSAAPGDADAIALLLGAARSVAPRAPRTAGRWFLAAARLLPAEAEDRASLLGRAGALLTSGGSFDEALDALDEALEVVGEEQPGLRATLVARHAEACRRGGRPFVDANRLRRAVAALGDMRDERALDVRLELAMNRYWHAAFTDMHTLAGEVRDVGHDRAGELLVCTAATLSSLSSGSTGAIDDAEASFGEAWSAFESLRDERFAERIYLAHYIAEAALRLEHADLAMTAVRRGLDVAGATGQEATTRSWWGATVYAMLLKGDVRGADRTAEGVLERGVLDSDDWRMLWMAAAYSAAACASGDGDRALATAREMVQRAERSHAQTYLPDLGRVAMSAALSCLGEHTGVVAELAPITDQRRRWILDLQGARGWELLIRSHLAAGEVAAAADASELAQISEPDARLAQRSATLTAAQAELLLAQDDPAIAVKTADHAMRLADVSQNPVLIGRCRTVLGIALAGTGDRDAAIAELEAAERSLHEVGAIRESDAAARELRRLGKRVTRRARRDRGAGVGSLTAREREIAEAVAAGKTNRQIATAMFLSEKTVESHLTSIYLKLDVHSRAALATSLAQLGAKGSQL